jgi:hypothetical protein
MTLEGLELSHAAPLVIVGHCESKNFSGKAALDYFYYLQGSLRITLNPFISLKP